MASSDYESNFPWEVYAGNLQEERMDQDAETISEARDYNIHDKEIRAIQMAVGALPAGTDPTGSLHGRIYRLEHLFHNELPGIGPDDHHPQRHDISGSDHTGHLDFSHIMDVTGMLYASVTGWMNKIYGTGDLDGDGVSNLGDYLAGLAFNKELLDDIFMVGFNYRWVVPTGGGPGIPPGGGGDGGGGGIPGPGFGGGVTDPVFPAEPIWAGPGSVGGDYTQPVGLMVNLDTGQQFAIQRLEDATGVLRGVVERSEVNYIYTYDSMPAGDRYALMFMRRAPTTEVEVDGTPIVGAAAGLRFLGEQVDVTETDSIATINVGYKTLNIDLDPDTNCVAEAVAPAGWGITFGLAAGNADLDGTIVVPDAGTYDIVGYFISSAANAGGNVWNSTTLVSINLGVAAPFGLNLVPPAVLGELFGITLASGITLAKDDLLTINLQILQASPHYVVDNGIPTCLRLVLRATDLG